MSKHIFQYLYFTYLMNTFQIVLLIIHLFIGKDNVDNKLIIVIKNINIILICM